MFALDHIYYLPVNLCNKLALKQIHSDVYRDHFVICKVEKALSMIAINQPHKQNIAFIKGYRGAIGLTEDKFKAFFLSFSLFMPILLNLLGGLQEVFQLPSDKWG